MVVAGIVCYFLALRIHAAEKDGRDSYRKTGSSELGSMASHASMASEGPSEM